jgi:hypothetical protein
MVQRLMVRQSSGKLHFHTEARRLKILLAFPRINMELSPRYERVATDRLQGVSEGHLT